MQFNHFYDLGIAYSNNNGAFRHYGYEDSSMIYVSPFQLDAGAYYNYGNVMAFTYNPNVNNGNAISIQNVSMNTGKSVYVGKSRTTNSNGNFDYFYISKNFNQIIYGAGDYNNFVGGSIAQNSNRRFIPFNFYGNLDVMFPYPNLYDITNLSNGFKQCRKLVGSPFCGENIVELNYTYQSCYNITGNPVCGSRVRNMVGAYGGCVNLTGSPVCGNNVVNMSYTYEECKNLTGSPVCGPNVVNMYQTYTKCYQLNGNMFMQSDNVTNVEGMLSNCNNNQHFDIGVNLDTITNTKLYNTGKCPLFGEGGANKNGILDTTNEYYYCNESDYNIYVHYNGNGQIW